ncbi:MAG: inositol monophosphatase [bacterium]
MSKFLTVAKKAIREASKITLDYYSRQNFSISIKKDNTPVTIADKKAEKTIIKVIKESFPNHGFWGEETGVSKNNSEFIWIIDPIDGTKNFIAGIPLWGTLIALMHNDEVILGLSYVPLMKETLWAEREKGAFLNGKRVHVSHNKNLKQSMISFGSLKTFYDKKLGKNIIDLSNKCKRQRSFGDLYPYHLLAAGKIELVVEAALKLVDVAPFDCIIREAGGMSSDLKGKSLDIEISSFVASNGGTHKEALDILNK